MKQMLHNKRIYIANIIILVKMAVVINKKKPVRHKTHYVKYAIDGAIRTMPH